MTDETDISDFTPDMEGGSKGVGLATQHLDDLKDLNNFGASSLKVMSRQATINIGTIGHVAHGKSTVVMAISGVKTTKFKKEAVMNITIHLGYANAKIYRKVGEPEPDCYVAASSSHPDDGVDPKTGAKLELLRHVSFVDCPGHEFLMTTMLNGASVMDAALLLIAANEPFPQPQTLEHLKAVEIMRLNNIVVLQNKIDLVKESAALTQFQLIKSYFKKTVGLTSPIIPISAQLGYNIDAVLDYLIHLPMPKRELKCAMRMVIVRSFDVNRPGEDIEKLQGGVAGGSVQKGILKVGQQIEVRPGLIHRDEAGVFFCEPIFSTAVNLVSEQNPLQYAIPGGLIACGTKVDPTLSRQNKLVGQIIGDVGSLPDVISEVEIQYNLLSQIVGVKTQGGPQGAAVGESSKVTKIAKFGIDESLQFNFSSLTTGGTVVAVSGDIVKVALLGPVCATVGDHVAISRRIDKHSRLIGWGTVRRGVPIRTELN